jgi:hypothetical protein
LELRTTRKSKELRTLPSERNEYLGVRKLIKMFSILGTVLDYSDSKVLSSSVANEIIIIIQILPDNLLLTTVDIFKIKAVSKS